MQRRAVPKPSLPEVGPSLCGIGRNSNDDSPKLLSHKSKWQNTVKLGRFRDNTPMLHTPHFNRVARGMQAVRGDLGRIVGRAVLLGPQPRFWRRSLRTGNALDWATRSKATSGDRSRFWPLKLLSVPPVSSQWRGRSTPSPPVDNQSFGDFLPKHSNTRRFRIL